MRTGKKGERAWMQMLDSLNSKASPRGFTLVEVLILLLIISIVFGLTIDIVRLAAGK